MRTDMLSAFLLPWTLACATVTGMVREPVAGGRAHRYGTTTDSVAAAAVRAFSTRGLRVVSDTMVGQARLLVGKVGMTPFSWGELDRMAITPHADATEVRIMSRPINRLDFLHRDSSPILFGALDRELGGSGIGPFPGDRVRLVTTGPERKTLTGRLRGPSDGAGVLSIEANGRDEVVAATDVARISISRGGYGHAKEGAIVGVLVGGVTGIAVAAGGSGSDWGGLEGVAGFALGSLIGLVTGGTVGALIRTEIWSDVSPKVLEVPRVASP